MQLIGVQLDILWEDREANLRRVRELLEASPPPPGSLVALPEMFGSGFSMNVLKIAERSDCATQRFLSDVSRRYQCTIVGGMAVALDNNRGANLAVVATPPDGAIAKTYSKLHPFSPGKEKQHYEAGDKIILFDWNDLMVAPLICYDLRFPEAFRRATRRGAQVLVVIANWPSPRVEHWITLLRARAIENQAYVLGVNRCGNDPYLAYPGRSLIVDFRGNILADAREGETIITAEIDPAAQATYRKELPFLGDMREDLVPR